MSISFELPEGNDLLTDSEKRNILENIKAYVLFRENIPLSYQQNTKFGFLVQMAKVLYHRDLTQANHDAMTTVEALYDLGFSTKESMMEYVGETHKELVKDVDDPDKVKASTNLVDLVEHYLYGGDTRIIVDELYLDWIDSREKLLG
jgi:hypothetical protein